jgi:hypothetical protein
MVVSVDDVSSEFAYPQISDMTVGAPTGRNWANNGLRPVVLGRGRPFFAGPRPPPAPLW